MVPSPTLIAVAALVVIPAATLAGVAPGGAVPAVMACALLGAIAVWDAWDGQQRLQAITSVLPPNLRWAQGRSVPLSLALENRNSRAAAIRAALVMPDGIACPTELQPATLAAGQVSALEWECVGERLGDHPLRHVHLELTSRLGLWHARDQRPASCLLRVFPNLRDPATLALLDRQQAGPRLLRTVGQGREFEMLRDYSHGDSFEDMHWKATARRGRPVVKQYQAEHAQEIYLVIDHSRLSVRDHTCEHFIGAALHLALAAESNGDRFGTIAYSDRAHLFLPPRSGTGHFRACREAIYNLRPQPVNPDFREVFAGIQMKVRRRSLLVFFTCLDDPLLAEAFDREVGVLARRHLVVVHTMQTSGTQPLFSGASAPASMPEAYQSLAGQMLWNRLRTLELGLSNRGVRTRIVTPETIRARAVESYLDVKRRQLL